MVKTREERLEQMKQYGQTPQGKKSNRISNWKRQGMEHEDWDLLYEWFLSVTNCEKCDILLTVDKRTTSTTKCLDHDHETGEIRYVLCHSCNTNGKESNTSGIANISIYKNGYRYRRLKNKITHSKFFKTKEEAIKYKEEYERN